MTHTTATPTPEVPMTTFTATLSASTLTEAIAKVDQRLERVPGFATTGRAAVRSERHRLIDVEVTNLGGDVNDCWVWLTSYGITPSTDLGSSWESTLGASA